MGKHREVVHSALSVTLVVSALLVLSGLAVSILDLGVFRTYSFARYAGALTLIAGLDHFRQVFANIYRIQAKLTRIAAGELFLAAVPTGAVLLFRGQELIDTLLISLVVSGIVADAIFVLKPTFDIGFSVNLGSIRGLLWVGVPLLVYNVCFYLITVSSRTIISVFYPVETMGYYSFANSITNATLLGLGAISWVVYPVVLARMGERVADQDVAVAARRVTDLFSTAVFLAVFTAVVAMPLLFLFLEQFKPAGPVISVLLLSQAVLSASFGYNSLAIARKKQLEVAALSAICVLVVTGLGIASAHFGLSFLWIAVSTLIGCLLFTVLQVCLSARLICCPGLGLGALRNVLPLGTSVALALFVVSSLIDSTAVAGFTGFAQVTGLVVFGVSNRRKIRCLWEFASSRGGPNQWDVLRAKAVRS